MSRVDWRTGSHRSTSDRDTSPAPIRFPPDNFKHSLTLFSKSFSSFPRGTCSLSVSRQYLALDGIYRPIGAAFPNNPTRRQRLVVRQGPGTTGLSPSLAPPSRGLGPGPPLRTLLQTTIRTPKRVIPPDLRSHYECSKENSRGQGPNVRGSHARLASRITQLPFIMGHSTKDSYFNQPQGNAYGKPTFTPQNTLLEKA
ncbi:hypothetical protein VNO77_38163 [Canavalia gladiata]|uniref:Protein TAR1 n=1 Tax=Canavalia gladiata TaxID=3824 RepID=A0AAN9KBN8_CANGL